MTCTVDMIHPVSKSTWDSLYSVSNDFSSLKELGEQKLVWFTVHNPDKAHIQILIKVSLISLQHQVFPGD